MAENTKIEWAHHTFNPWIGCTKVGPGCDNCYAEADFDKRRHVVQWGPNQPRKLTAPSTWAQPLRWNAMAKKEGTRYRVFCASLADVFDNEVPVQWRASLFEIIEETPHLDWLLLTKRIGNAAQMIREARLSLVGSTRLIVPDVLPNVWLGATITSQAEADRDIPKLLAAPAAKRFLSMEPLLGPVELCEAKAIRYMCGTCAAGLSRSCFLSQPGRFVDWVIVGGESGPNARPMHPDWARSLRDQCQAAGVPFLFKQWGEWASVSETPVHPEAIRIPGNLCRVTHDGVTTDHYVAISTNGGRKRYALQRIGKKAAGRLLDGREWNEVPA